MGEKDKIEKLLEDYPDVFADIINVLVYASCSFISGAARETSTPSRISPRMVVPGIPASYTKRKHSEASRPR